MRIITLSSGAQQFVDLSTGAVPQGIAVMPNGSSALVTLGITGTSIKRVNLSTLAVTTITSTGPTFGVAVLPDNTAAVVAAGQQDTMKRLDLTGNTTSTIVAYGSNTNPHNVALTPDGTKAVVVGDFTTAVISLSTNAILATFPNGGSSVAVTPDGKYGLVTSLTSGSASSGVIRVLRIP
jgi:streptogramin lyase